MSQLQRLVEIVDRLLGPDGCPWDQAQTHESLKKHLLEECYELFEAIDTGESDKLVEELGDVLLQPIMHGQMAARDGRFSTEDVAKGICDKLVRRHPHVFSDVDAPTAEQVLKNWDAIKKAEGKNENQSILAGVPRTLPSLLRAHEISKRAARIGFEWPHQDAVFEKLDEEIGELKQAISSGDPLEIEAELGDLLFTIVNVARWQRVEPEEALRKMVERFSRRFVAMETASQKPLGDLSPDEWDSLWSQAKEQVT